MAAFRPPDLAPAGPVRRGDVPHLCDQVRTACARAPARDIVCDLAAVTTADLATVDALARMQLAARRAGSGLRLRDPSPALWALLQLVGLPGLGGLVVEMEGHAEQREIARCVQEAVESGDPAL
ncbi:STAS domain-containing protein [Streptomyces sp. NBC_01003]|uniref:STAS domain-containing protein n=1 Tax=Streptomyces sp. NBC_01003 TaxID=2903714 RepID=UPI00386815F7|nr:STAS domain-containing protein [Streptomyces sp. NBC_01003]